MDNLNEGRRATQSLRFGNLPAALLLLLNFIACEGFLQYGYEREIAGDKYRMLTLLGI